MAEFLDAVLASSPELVVQWFMDIVARPLVREENIEQVNSRMVLRKGLSGIPRSVMPKPVSEAVKNLVVDKAEFDSALRKLIATPPLRAAAIAKRKTRATRRVPASR